MMNCPWFAVRLDSTELVWLCEKKSIVAYYGHLRFTNVCLGGESLHPFFLGRAGVLIIDGLEQFGDHGTLIS